jgi:hypothetical protein
MVILGEVLVVGGSALVVCSAIFLRLRENPSGVPVQRYVPPTKPRSPSLTAEQCGFHIDGVEIWVET